MNRRAIWIIVVSLIFIALGVGVLFLLIPREDVSKSADQPIVDQIVTDPTEETFSHIPDSPTEINWEDREIYRPGLVSSMQDVLDDLPLATNYQIKLEIPPDLISEITGHQIVRYFNTEEQALSEIYFRLFPNYTGGSAEVSQLIMDGEEITPILENNNTSLRLDLDEPLPPGESLVIEMEFILGVPTEMGGNYGAYGYFDDVLALDAFYPTIPVYDENGWYSSFPQPNGDHTYNDASFYLVEVEAPADLVLASSGVEVDKKLDGETQTTLFAAGPARDFYLAGSREFVEQSQQVGETAVRVFTKEEYYAHQVLAIDFATYSLNILGERLGTYPYTEFDLLSSPMLALGIEYPGITSLAVDQFDPNYYYGQIPSVSYLETTIAHEAAHMWFYNIVGNDQQNDPWLDEGLAQYLTYIYYRDRYGFDAGKSYYNSWFGRWNRVGFDEQPIGLPAEEYYSEETGGLAYGAIVYGRAPIFFLELENQYGLEVIMDAIRNLYQDHLWGVIKPDDVLVALEDACECELDGFYNEWVYGE